MCSLLFIVQNCHLCVETSRHHFNIWTGKRGLHNTVYGNVRSLKIHDDTFMCSLGWSSFQVCPLCSLMRLCWFPRMSSWSLSSLRVDEVDPPKAVHVEVWRVCVCEAWNLLYLHVLTQLEADVLHESYANPSGVSNLQIMCVADSWAAAAQRSGRSLFE